MQSYTITYKHKNESEPYFTTSHEAESAADALSWANKQLTTDSDNESIIEISEDFVK